MLSEVTICSVLHYAMLVPCNTHFTLSGSTILNINSSSISAATVGLMITLRLIRIAVSLKIKTMTHGKSIPY